MSKVKINDVFEYKGSFYKVISEKQVNTFSKHLSYSAIKCNKNGLEFLGRTSFVADYVEKAERWQALKNEKASTKNKTTGEMKRRVNYLKRQIEAYTKELNELTEKLASKQ